MTLSAAAELLVELVRTPSPSGHEQRVAGVLAGWLEARGLAPTVDDAAVRLEVDGGRPGPTLLLASHLDTVPPGDGWTGDPYAGAVDGDRLIGRGAVDAKASVAAMAEAAADLAACGGPSSGRLVVLATFSEETRDTTMPEALRRLGRTPDAAVVGEPTSLAPCIAQRGQLLLELVWDGDQVHAGWAAGRTPPPVNAIVSAARDLVALEDLSFSRHHPLLGDVAVSPTIISGGRRPQRHPGALLGRARHPHHPGLPPRRGGGRDHGPGPPAGWRCCPTGWCRPRPRRARGCSRRCTRCGPRRRPSRHRPARTGCFCATSTPSSWVPAIRAGRTPRTSGSTLVEVATGARLYADLAREYLR